MGYVIFYLILSSAVLFFNYLIIKLAVKHAIIACLSEIKASFRDGVSQSITQYEWDKNNK